MFVRNWMSSPAVVISPVVPVPAALAFMEKHEIRRLPVVDEGKLLGMVTKSDLAAAVGREKDLFVADVMAKKPVTVSADETLERAAKIMLDRKISGLPVVDEEKVVGIITESDAFRALSEILGLRETGARMVLTVGEDEDLLRAIGTHLSGRSLRSLATYHNPMNGRWEIVMRVRGKEPAQVSV